MTICQCGHCGEYEQHASDCAVHNPPALPAGKCTCFASEAWALHDSLDLWTKQQAEEILAALRAAHKRGKVDGLKDAAGWALQQKSVFAYASERIAQLEAEQP